MINRRTFVKNSAVAALLASISNTACVMCQGTRQYRIAVNASTLRAFKFSFLEQVKAVAASGIKGFEPWMRDVHAAIADGTFDEAKCIADEHGIEFINGIAFGKWADPDPKIREAGLAETRKDMIALKRLGCKRIAASMFGVQKPGSPILSLDEIAERFKAVLAIGDEIGIQPLLEYWGHSVNLNTPAAALEVLKKVGRSDTAILPDVYHTYRGGGWFGDFARMKASQIPVLHVNDYTFAKSRRDLVDADRVWQGDGMAPWKSIFAMLDAIGAQPWLSVELFRDEYCRVSPRRTLETVRTKFSAIETKNPIRLAVQMWSVNEIWKKNPLGAFRRLRAMGYEGVQSYGFYSMDWKELAKMLDGEGLKIVDMPFYMKDIKGDGFKRFLDFCRTFDIRFAYEPWFGGKTTEDWKTHLAKLAEIRTLFASEGIRCGYHNHQHESKPFADGVRPIDLIEKAGIDFELDVGHVKLANDNPAMFMKSLPGRVPSIHAKPGGGCSVGGEGDNNDWSAIIAAAYRIGCEWAVVECETRRNTFKDVERSIKFLKALI